MKINRIFSGEFDIISNFLLSNFSSPTHWPDWNLVVSEHYNTEFFYFAAYEKNLLVGICPAHRIKSGSLYKIISGQFHFIPNGGWIFANNYVPKKVALPLKYNESFLSNELPSLPEFDKRFENIEYGAAETLIIDLKKEIDDIWSDEIDSKRRNMIRKAGKLGVELCRLQKNEFDEFYKIYASANKRYGLKSMSKEMFLTLFYNSKNIGFEVLLAKYNDVIQSAVVVAYDKNYATYWLGFSNDGAKNNGEGDLLQWEAIKFTKQQGCGYYDLCYIDKKKLPHIYRFKKGFSKNEVLIPIINQRPFIYKVLNRLSKWF